MRGAFSSPTLIIAANFLLALAAPAVWGAQGPNAGSDSAALQQRLTLDRQALRQQQTVLTLPEQREAQRRLDAISGQAGSDPAAASQMLNIYEKQQRLATTNRPIPGGPQTPSLVGPGDKF